MKTATTTTTECVQRIESYATELLKEMALFELLCIGAQKEDAAELMTVVMLSRYLSDVFLLCADADERNISATINADWGWGDNPAFINAIDEGGKRANALIKSAGRDPLPTVYV